MKLSSDEVAKVANLARLEANQSLASDLTVILDFVDQMRQVDTKNVEPMAHPLNTTQPTRPDIVTEPNQREQCSVLAERVETGVYLVPKVIETIE